MIFKELLSSLQELSVVLATANTSTYKPLELVRHTAAAQTTHMKLPLADLYGWSWGRCRVSEDPLTANTEPKYLNID